MHAKFANSFVLFCFVFFCFVLSFFLPELVKFGVNFTHFFFFFFEGRENWEGLEVIWGN